MQSKTATENEPNARYRVLVADDNIINCTIAARMLEKLGCHVDVASTGTQVLEMHARHPYDLILMDCQMPGIDGYQATLRIRADEKQGQHTTIIGWTAVQQNEDRVNCLAAGMDDVMPKNLHAKAAREMLSHWLRPCSEPISAGDEMSLDAMHQIIGKDYPPLAALFLSDMHKRLIALEDAAAQLRMDEIARIAHVMSGSCASIGARHLSRICQDLEIQAREGVIDNLQPQLEALETMYSAIQRKLQSLANP